MLHLAIPALEALFKAWDSRRSREKYASFAEALSIGTAKIAEYYDKTGDSDAYIVSMCKKVPLCSNGPIIDILYI